MATATWTKPKPDSPPVVKSREKWEGGSARLPWEYQVTAVIPHIDTPEELALVVELLRLQTVQPFIIVVDTGSTPANLDRVLEMRASDLEVHTLQLNGVRHPSDPVAMAMDLATMVCRTRFMFCTHADCFLRHRNVLDEMATLCEDDPVVGYQLSPRPHDDWKWMVGHTCTMLDIDWMDRHNITWSQRRLARNFGAIAGIDSEDYAPCPTRPNWPDTELNLNYMVKATGIDPLIIGSEENRQRNITTDFDHPRSYVSAKMYSPKYFQQVKRWMKLAKQEARVRIDQWRLADCEVF